MTGLLVETTAGALELPFGIDDKLLHYIGDRSLGVDQPNRLTSHQRAMIYVPLFHGRPEAADPELLDFYLGIFPGNPAAVDVFKELELKLIEVAGGQIPKCPHGYNGEPAIKLGCGHGVAGFSVDESLLEPRVCTAFLSDGKDGSELHSCGTHEKQVGAHPPCCDSAADEDRYIRDLKQNLLKQDRKCNAADVTSCFHAFQDKSVGTVVKHAPGYRMSGGEAEYLSSCLLGRFHLGAAREIACEDHEGDLQPLNKCQVIVVCRGNRNEIHTKGFIGQAPGLGNLLFKHATWHIAACEACEATRLGYGSHKRWIADPCHRAADEGISYTKEIAALL
jgi:hypothetical protein